MKLFLPLAQKFLYSEFSYNQSSVAYFFVLVTGSINALFEVHTVVVIELQVLLLVLFGLLVQELENTLSQNGSQFSDEIAVL